MKNYLVIGASSGIGLALAAQLAQAGHQVVGTFRHTEVSHPNIAYHYLNIQDAELKMAWCPEVLHGVVYCPGAIVLKPFHRIAPADFIRDYELQVIGIVKVLQAVLPALKRADHAAIVLFSTVAVQTGFPFHSMVSASKGAIEGLTKALAAELAPAIRVNCIAPSITQTPLAATLLNTAEKITNNGQRHPLRRVGQPEEVAQVAAFLLSDAATWMTGQIIGVDGGMSSVKV